MLSHVFVYVHVCVEALLRALDATKTKITRTALDKSAYLCQAMPDPVEHIGSNKFLKHHAIYRFLASSLNEEESLQN